MEKGSASRVSAKVCELGIKGRVLVVEDDEELSEVLIQALEVEGYTVSLARSLAEARAEIAARLPSVLVCDHALPDGRGGSFLQDVRNDPSLNSIQFVLITGKVANMPRRVGMNRGADDYLEKPFSVADFLKCVDARQSRANYWTEKLRQRELEVLSGTLTQTLPHELFTPLAGVMGFTDLLEQELGGGSAGMVGDAIRGIATSAERLHRTLTNYTSILELSKAGGEEKASRGSSTPIGLLRPQWYKVLTRTGRRHQRLDDLRASWPSELREDSSIAVGGEDFAKILEELLDNAFKFSSSGQPVGMGISIAKGEVVIRVTDEGRGMTVHEIEKIGAFRQFDRTKFEQQGLGLGLTLCQHLVWQTRGRLHLESGLDGGTAATVRWPIDNQN